MGKVKKKMNGRKTRSSKKGLFSRECKRTDHDIVSVNGDVERLYTSNDYNKRDWSCLIENGKLTKRNTFVCNLCLDYTKKNCVKGNVSNTTQEQEQNANMLNRRSNQLALIIEDIYARRNSKYVGLKLLMLFTALLQLVEVLQHYVCF